MRGFLVAFLLAAPVVGHAYQSPMPAQTTPTAALQAAEAARPAKPKVAVPYKAAVPEQRAEKMSQQLGQQLGLDAATVAKVKAAALTRAQKIDAIQTGTDSNKAKNAALQANAQEFKGALQAILSPEQFAKYSSSGAKPAAH